MSKQHEISQYATGVSDELVKRMFSESYRALNIVLELAEATSNYRSGELDEDDYLTTIEDSLISKYENIRLFALNNVSRIVPVNRNLKKLFDFKLDEIKVPGVISTYNDLIKKYIMYAAGPQTNDGFENLKKVSDAVIGILSYALFFEFSISDTYAQIIESDGKVDIDRLDVDSVVRNYAERRPDLSLEEIVETITTALRTHRTYLAVFDLYPELEDQFFEIVGPYYADIDPEDLTLDIVQKVISGKIRPDDLYDEVMKSNGGMSTDGEDIYE